LKGKTVLGIGPGLGTHPETQKFIRTVVRETPLPTILDADGLNAFAGSGDLFRDRQSKFPALVPRECAIAESADAWPIPRAAITGMGLSS